MGVKVGSQQQRWARKDVPSETLGVPKDRVILDWRVSETSTEHQLVMFSSGTLACRGPRVVRCLVYGIATLQR